eukprot:TRINITY_DN6895_c0_g1_i2.p1 TRINITY_DN6895_c0_g1~~TRINITY_DN6895_c0_g1_i2.p1  ORF type:complete len:329 (+),score=55.20 TRINITY_DN6895_c0_g1_i2:382-1368(+)
MSKYTSLGESQINGSFRNPLSQLNSPNSRPIRGEKLRQVKFVREASPPRGSIGRSPSAKGHPSARGLLQLTNDEEKFLARSVEDLSQRIIKASTRREGFDEEIDRLLAAQTEVYHALLQKFHFASPFFEKLRENAEQIGQLVRRQSVTLRFLREENEKALKDKATAMKTVSRLRRQVMELGDAKQHFENRVIELQKELDGKRTRLNLGFDLRTLVEENDSLKQELKEQAKSVDYMKSKEVKLIKLLYFVKKDGVDIDAVYQRHAEEIQNENDESQFYTEGSLIEGDEGPPEVKMLPPEPQEEQLSRGARSGLGEVVGKPRLRGSGSIG